LCAVNDTDFQVERKIQILFKSFKANSISFYKISLWTQISMKFTKDYILLASTRPGEKNYHHAPLQSWSRVTGGGGMRVYYSII
jgi:hypothetical protein